MVRFKLRWLLYRLGLVAFVLLAMQFFSHLGLLTIQKAEYDQSKIFREAITLSSLQIRDAPTAPRGERTETSNTIQDSDLNRITNELKRLAAELSETQRNLVSSVTNYHRVGQHIQLLHGIIRSLTEENLTNANSHPHQADAKFSQRSSNKQEVCPETFKGKDLSYGYPYFRKGFDIDNCSDYVPINDLVTILMVLPKELSTREQLDVFKGIASYYPNIRVILAVKEKLSSEVVSTISNLKLNFKSIVSKDFSEGLVWSKLLVEVDTPYALFAPDITHFTDDVNLERLIRVLSYNKDTIIAGGSHRNLRGEWDIGCLQVLFRNWTAYYRGGYYRSFSECVVCDVLSGPFVAKTESINHLGLDDRLSFGVFQDLFWRLKLKKPGLVVASCPDVMFNVYDRDVPDENYANLANKWHVKKWVESNGRVRWYGCRRGQSYTRSGLCNIHAGLAVPPCDLENLADAIKFVMKECEEAGLFCELQEGTLLGAVKFNKVLPWERDADITFLTANYSAFKRLRPKLYAAGYSLTDDDNSLWCCIDGRRAGGKFRISTLRWTLELYGQHKMESEMLVASGQKPTKVQLAGQWVTVMRNPGLFARNRYGPNMYRHAEHWMETGHDSGWAFYEPSSFSACPQPGHSACLDQYPADGNIQFSDYALT